MTTIRFLAAIFVVTTACASEADDPRRKASSLAEVSNMCDAWLGWTVRCDRESSGFYDECTAEPRWELVWNDAVDALNGCFDSLSCTASDDDCLTQALDVLDVDPSEDGLFADCLDRASECGSLDDDCAGVLIYHDAARGAFSECLTLPCDTFAECVGS